MQAHNSRAFWDAIRIIAPMITAAYREAWAVLLERPSAFQHTALSRARARLDARVVEETAEILIERFSRLDPGRRPDYTPSERRRIITLKHLSGWTTAQTANRFVVCPNTIRSWMHEAECKIPVRRLAAVPWNKYHDQVRHVVRLLRAYFPERHIGVRTIAGWFVQHGIQVSKSFVHDAIQKHPPGTW